MRSFKAALALLFFGASVPAQAQTLEDILGGLFGIRPPEPQEPRRPPVYQPSIPPRQSREPQGETETRIIPVPSEPQIGQRVDIPPGGGEHVGTWSSWKGMEPIGGAETFSDKRSCFNTLSGLVNKYNYEVTLTCEDASRRVALYYVCKPTGTDTPACFRKN